MKRITREHTIGMEGRYRVLEPAAEVELGETFVVETINFRTPIIRTPEDASPENFREREESVQHRWLDGPASPGLWHWPAVRDAEGVEKLSSVRKRLVAA